MRKVLAVVLGVSVVSVLTSLGQGCSKWGMHGKTGDVAQSAETPTSCATPAGFSGAPKSIEEAIAMINKLPKPVTVGCFLESLQRPLNVTLTNSVTSAQPAFSTRSPRIFILMDSFTISVVPEGDGGKVVELSVLTPPATSLKGELAFPVTAELAPSAAFDRIRFGSGTVCQFCHANETRADDITWATAFRSNAVRPKPEKLVDLEYLRTEWTTCDAVAEPERCAVLKGLFGHGEVQAKDFPSDYGTLF